MTDSLAESIKDLLVPSGLTINEYRAKLRDYIQFYCDRDVFKQESFYQQFLQIQAIQTELYEVERDVFRSKLIKFDEVLKSNGISSFQLIYMDKQAITLLDDGVLQGLLNHSQGYDIASALKYIEYGEPIFTFDSIFSESFSLSRSFVNNILAYQPVITRCVHDMLNLSGFDSLSCCFDMREMTSQFWSNKGRFNAKNQLVFSRDLVLNSFDELNDMPRWSNIFKLSWWQVKMTFGISVMLYLDFIPLVLRVMILALPIITHHKTVRDFLKNKQLSHWLDYLLTELSSFEEAATFVCYFVIFSLIECSYSVPKELPWSKGFSVTNVFLSIYHSVKNIAKTGLMPIYTRAYAPALEMLSKVHRRDKQIKNQENSFTRSELTSPGVIRY